MFDALMRAQEVLSLRVRVDLGVMVMKEYSTFSKSLEVDAV